MSPFLCRDRTCEFFVESHPCFCELPPGERPSWCPYNADEEIAEAAHDQGETPCQTTRYHRGTRCAR